MKISELKSRVWNGDTSLNSDTHKTDSLNNLLSHLNAQDDGQMLRPLLSLYVEGQYRDVLRKLDQNADLNAVILKLLCILQLLQKQTISMENPGTHSLVERLIIQARSVTHLDRTGKLAVQIAEVEKSIN